MVEARNSCASHSAGLQGCTDLSFHVQASLRLRIVAGRRRGRRREIRDTLFGDSGLQRSFNLRLLAFGATTAGDVDMSNHGKGRDEARTVALAGDAKSK